MSLQGVLFDVDGTLVDSTYLHTVTWWEALRQHGHDVPMARIHRSIGMGSDKIVENLLGPDRDRDADEKLRNAHSAHYSSYWDRLRALPGARDLLHRCANRGLRVVLASSASQPEFDILLRVLDSDDVIAATTSAADVEQTKPAPDIIEVALSKSGLSADSVVFVGDSIWDVKAAGRVAIPCVGFTCGGLGGDELRQAGAVAVYDSPQALLDEFDRSPLAPK